MLNLDLLVDYAVTSAEMENGIPVAMVRRQSNVPPACMPTFGQSKKARGWSNEETEFLRSKLGYMEESQIAAALGRSLIAVHLRWSKYLDFPAPSKHPDFLTGQQISKRLGADTHKVCSWIDRGLLPGEIRSISMLAENCGTAVAASRHSACARA